MTASKAVVVVGAGPVGLFAALTLARRGVEVVVVEANSSLGEQSKASTFHPSTLDLLAASGVLESFLSQGIIVDRLQWRNLSNEVLAEIPFSLLRDVAQHPFRLHAEQTLLTPILLQKIEELAPGAVRFNSRCEAVDIDEDGVTLTVSESQVARTVRAGYLIAADGAHSTIRKQAGIDFPGTSYESRALRVVTESDLGALLDNLAGIAYVRDERQSCSLLHMRDHWRLIFRVTGHDSDATILEPSHVRELVDRVVPDIDISFAEVYSNRAHVADGYTRGRLALMGDAAHVTTTAGGMNMNCGLHDAYEVANAIADVVEGGDPALIEVAGANRRRVVRETIIPRTEQRAAGADGDVEALERAVDTIVRTADDPNRAFRYIFEASMLDTVPRIRKV